MWWIVGAYLVVATAILAANARPHAQENAVLRFQNSVGVDLPQGLGRQLRKRMLTNRRCQLVGGMVGIVGSASVVSFARSLPEHLALWIVIGGTFTGTAIGVASGALLNSRSQSDDHERFARATAVGLNDYLSPIDRGIARLPVALAVVALPLSLIGAELGWAPVVSQSMFIGGGVLTAMAVASLIVFEVAGRRLVAKGRPAGSLEELVWDDAFRFHTLRELCFAPFVLSAYGLGLTASGLGIMSGGIEVVNTISLGVFGMLMLCGIIALWAARMSKSQRHFLRRLWPELATEADNPVGADA